MELDADSDVAARIGRRLAELRVRRGVRAAELARQISVTPSLISQIERGQSRPSVTTLFALAQALEVPVDAFFARDAVAEGEPPADTGVVGAGDPASWPAGGAADPARTPVWRAPEHPPELVLHQAQRAAIDIKGGVRWERLTPTALNGVEFLELVYQPGAESAGELYRHPGVELVLVLENRMDIHVGFEVSELHPGDSIAFPSSTPHRYVNPTDEVTRAITVILRDDLSTLPIQTATQIE